MEIRSIGIDLGKATSLNSRTTLSSTGSTNLRRLATLRNPMSAFVAFRRSVALVSVAFVFAFVASRCLAQPGPSDGSGFLGAWCPQGDPTKHASIAYQRPFFNLTNENGSTSFGNVRSNEMSAPQWFVRGTLSPDGSRIDWDNGTFWARCNGGGGGSGQRRPDLNGTWYPQGNRSLQCSIQQHKGVLNLKNESGAGATGSFDGRRHITTNWSGTQIGGNISANGNRIDWDNGTYWIRNRVY